jgi:hypothetical protein
MNSFCGMFICSGALNLVEVGDLALPHHPA